MDLGTLGLVFAVTAGLHWDATASFRGETQAGLISTTPGQPGQESIVLSISPALSGGVESGALRLNLSYSPRMFRRFQRANSTTSRFPDNFLVLHSFGGGVTQTVARGFQITAAVNLAAGATDYIGASEVLNGEDPTGGTVEPPTTGGSVGSAVNAATVDVFTVSGGLSLSGQIERRTTFSAGVNFNYAAQPGSTSGGTVTSTLPTTLGFGVATSFGYAITSRDQITAGFNVEFADFTEVRDTAPGAAPVAAPDRNFRNITLNAGYSRTISERASVAAQGGVLVITSGSGASFSPVASASASYRAVDTRKFRLGTQLSAGIDGFADRVAGTFQTRLGVQFGLSMAFPPDWTVGVLGSFYTPVSLGLGGDPNVPSAGIVATTSVGLSVPVSYRVNEFLAVEVGGQFNAFDTRGTAGATPNAGGGLFSNLGAINAVGYVAVTLSVEEQG